MTRSEAPDHYVHLMLPHAALLVLAMAPPPASLPEPPLQTVTPTSSAPVDVAPPPTEASPTEARPAATETVPNETPPAATETVPAPAAAAIDETPIELAPATVEPVELPTQAPVTEASAQHPYRRGVLIGAGFGIVGCETNECDFSSEGTGYRFRAGLHGQVELGYRFGRVAPVVSTALGGGRDEHFGEFSGLESTTRFFNLDVGLLVFPMKRGRFDPYFGARLGSARASSRISAPAGIDASGLVRYLRAGGRLTAGLDVYLGARTSIGPRIDLTLPFGGRVCSSFQAGDDFEGGCANATDLPKELRRELPRWWTVSLQLHVVIPVAKRR